MPDTQSNPILKKSNLQHQAVNFDAIKPEHYLPALKSAIEIAKQNIQKIKEVQTPDFHNTIEALETSSEKVGTVASVFFNLLHAHATDELQALAKDISPLLASFGNDIYLDATLFEKVKHVYDQKPELNTEEKTLLNNAYDSFIRSGALLSTEDKDKLKEISEKLSVLTPQFSENILKSTNSYKLIIENIEDIPGLSEDILEAAKTEKGWEFSLQAPSVIPFLTYCSNRDLREKMWKAFASRSMHGEFSNQDIIKQIVTLRYQEAKLLGYDNYASYVLEKNMAKDVDTVMSFLNDLLEASSPAAKRDVKMLTDLALETDGISKLMTWDTAYYKEKLKTKLYDFEEGDLKPYFSLDNVTNGIFIHADKLYGLQFKKSEDYSKYHEDVSVYEVIDKASKEFMGLFYMDFFPRETKSQGAWKTTYVDQGLFEGKVLRPHVSVVCNFTKPTSKKPSLLNLREVETLFHEFGHALHALLSKCKYQSIGGTHVYRDFVELPSQILENWAFEKEALNLYAEHYETHEKMPDEFIQKIKDSSQFMAGFNCLRQLKFGFLDMAWHTSTFDNPGDFDVVDFDKKATEHTEITEFVEGTNTSCAFSHIFAGGYAAGYYGYKWAEVLDADAFELFKEKGLYNAEVADSFKQNILARGGSEHPMDLYKKFRGREPKVDALLKREGLS
ncbi:MAG: M3 family metallopeptidase [Bdellovibrionaceae bacterium]|jgi:peptidyl-dipeptidase Dcp|nr:M3 family metallopeptidase [Pseudobdellovibrionaceae bacterium]